jgi:integrase
LETVTRYASTRAARVKGLTDVGVRQARARDRVYKLADGRGLCLLVQPNGSKWWRFRYQWAGKEKMLSLGTYPGTSLAEARVRRDALRRKIETGTDPGLARRLTQDSPERTFEAVAQHYLAGLERKVLLKKRSPATLRKARWALRDYVFRYLGSKPIDSITPQELLAVLKKIETLGMLETARRTRQRCGQVFRHGIGLGYCSRDITVDLKGLLEAPIVEHHASITNPREVGGLLRAIEQYSGRELTRLALKLSPLVFVRAGELRKAEREHFDLERAEWRIPHRLMKMKEAHLVPLSRQAVDIVRELLATPLQSRYLFPALGHPESCMSENTIGKALQIMGYAADDMSAHGFRSLASTLLNEAGWPADAIEAQLAHQEQDEVRGAYNFAKYLPLRRRMMQWWADYLDELRDQRGRSGEDMSRGLIVAPVGLEAQRSSPTSTTSAVEMK